MDGSGIRVECPAYPLFFVSVPALIHVNGKQVPPIETEGEITRFSLAAIQLSCNQWIPIPSSGVIRFMPETLQAELELNVNFVQRTRTPGRLWFAKSPRYIFHASIGDNDRGKVLRYQDFLHRLLYGGPTKGSFKVAIDYSAVPLS